VSDRTVFITGAAGGLGRAFALGFAGRGYRVAVADIDPTGVAETARLVDKQGAAAWHGGVDVTSPESVASVASAVAEFGDGRIDVVVNNAAVYAGLTRAPIDDNRSTDDLGSRLTEGIDSGKYATPRSRNVLHSEHLTACNIGSFDPALQPDNRRPGPSRPGTGKGAPRV